MSLAPAKETFSNPGLNFRPPQQVMRLARMGSAYPTRLSFMRSLVRRMARENWHFERKVWELDAEGFGRASWRIRLPSGTLSFAAFSRRLDPSERTDRVIAEKWDASFALSDGDLSNTDLDRLEANVPLQEKGRYAPSDLILSRANKSVRLFDQIVHSLASGQQPAISDLVNVGYLMRTTAVYGNGKFGMGDFPRVQAHPTLNGPYRAEMLIVFLIRQFSIELAEHIAKARLRPELKCALGVGNATGLGMAPFLIRHPILVHKWMKAREDALARVRSISEITIDKRARFETLLERALRHAAQWNVDDQIQNLRIGNLKAELGEIAGSIKLKLIDWNNLYLLCEKNYSVETQELMVSLLIELYPELVDELEDTMVAQVSETVDGKRTVSDIIKFIEHHYKWTLDIDFADHHALANFWYYSQNKEEPRLGKRYAEPGAEHEMRLGMGWYIKDYYEALGKINPSTIVAEFLLQHPHHRLAAKRVETTRRYPYGEIHDNVLDSSLRPIDLLRCKLAFFGAAKFDPKSDLWTRITMYQGAPLIEDLQSPQADDWWLPAFQS